VRRRISFPDLSRRLLMESMHTLVEFE
jgi:hypothetical protein